MITKNLTLFITSLKIVIKRQIKFIITILLIQHHNKDVIIVNKSILTNYLIITHVAINFV